VVSYLFITLSLHCTPPVRLYWHLPNFSDYCTGWPSNGESGSNLPLQPSKLYTLVIRQTSPTFYGITSPWGPCVHLPVTYTQFHGTTLHLVLVLFISAPKYGIPYNTKFYACNFSSYKTLRQ